MEFYKAIKDNVIFTNDSKSPSGEKASRNVFKGELLLVKKIEDLTDKKLSFPYKKYTLFNNNWVISIKVPNISEYDAYEKASFADVPEYLFLEMKKPKVYITLGVLLAGLAIYSIIKEQQNN